jgi:hypothetical protein
MVGRGLLLFLVLIRRTTVVFLFLIWGLFWVDFLIWGLFFG